MVTIDLGAARWATLGSAMSTKNCRRTSSDIWVRPTIPKGMISAHCPVYFEVPAVGSEYKGEEVTLEAPNRAVYTNTK